MTSAVSTTMHGDRGFSVPKPRPPYETYHSPYAPKYKIASNFHGVSTTTLRRAGTTAAMFGGVGLFTLLFFASDIPRVRIDILQKVPLIGPYFIKEVPPEDDPF